jgi:hypothetical protein
MRSKPTTRARRSPAATEPGYPALDRWRAEIRAGWRRPDTHDDLWLAAAWEQSSQRAREDGLIEAAERDLKQAAEIMGAARPRSHVGARARPTALRLVAEGHGDAGQSGDSPDSRSGAPATPRWPRAARRPWA